MKPQDLTFAPLPWAPWLLNAVVPVSEHFSLSVTYNPSPGEWYVGEYGNFQAAIMVGTPDRKFVSLVFMPDNERLNVYDNISFDGLERLKEIASKLEYGGAIEIFCSRDGKEDADWFLRECFAKGHDSSEKISYLRSVYGDDCLRILPPSTNNQDETKEETNESRAC